MTTEELTRALWTVCQHANDVGRDRDYASIVDRRWSIKVIKEAIKRLKKK